MEMHKAPFRPTPAHTSQRAQVATCSVLGGEGTGAGAAPGHSPLPTRVYCGGSWSFPTPLCPMCAACPPTCSAIMFRHIEGTERVKAIQSHALLQLRAVLCIAIGFGVIYRNKVRGGESAKGLRGRFALGGLHVRLAGLALWQAPTAVAVSAAGRMRIIIKAWC